MINLIKATLVTSDIINIVLKGQMNIEEGWIQDADIWKHRS